MMGRLADAQVSYQRRLKIVEQLARENPAEADYSMGIAGASHYLGRVQHMSGRLAAAETSHRRALEIYQELIHQDPSSGAYRIGAARTYYHLGLLQSVTGRRDEAAQSWATAATTYVAAGDLGYPRLQVFTGQGAALAMLGKWREAADAFAQGVDGSEHDWLSLFQLTLLRWAADDEAGYRLSCANLVSRYGENAHGAQAAAIAVACIAGLNTADDRDAVLAIIQRAAASNPRNPVYLTLVGAAQFRAGQTHEAIHTLTESLPIYSASESAELMHLEQISRLTGETILALAYREVKDEQALKKQLAVLRDLVGKLEATAPLSTEELGQWALSLTIYCTKRDLVRMEADALK